MKLSAKLLVLLFTAQVLPWAVQSAHAQAPGQTKAQREDAADGLKLQLEYRMAYIPLQLFSFKRPAHAADVVTETTRPLADGNEIKNKQTVSRYRDANGRVKVSYKTAEDNERIFIADPVAKFAYLIRPNRRDVLRLRGEAPPSPYQAMGEPMATRAPDWSKMVTTSLGVKEIDGTKVAGTLQETIYPAGARGNEKEMVESRETWRSNELAETIYMRSHSPREGERIVRYENLRLGDLPEVSFALPAGYAIRDIALHAGQDAPPAQ